MGRQPLAVLGEPAGVLNQAGDGAALERPNPGFAGQRREPGLPNNNPLKYSQLPGILTLLHKLGSAMSGSLLEVFDTIDDPRAEKNRLYRLDEVLLVCVCAVISGAEGWSAMAQFGWTKLDWFKRFLPYENGIPNEDTIAWLFKRLDIKAFERCFVQWAADLASASDGEVIAIDGKTARRSHDRRRGQSPLHVVSAWACEQRLSLGQLATEQKSNEITAIPELLPLLDVRGALITVDAMGCQKDIAEAIVTQQADYVLALKGNQGRLHEAVVDCFTVAEAADFAGVAGQFKDTQDTGHGRIETRTHYWVDDLSSLPDTAQWPGLAAIGMGVSTRTDKASGKSTTERRYYLCSTRSIDVFAHAARAHWGVENPLHWVLDMVFREDESRIRSGDSPALMNQLRQMANNLLRQVDSKLSVKARRFQAGIDDTFRERVVFQGA